MTWLSHSLAIQGWPAKVAEKLSTWGKVRFAMIHRPTTRWV